MGIFDKLKRRKNTGEVSGDGPPPSDGDNSSGLFHAEDENKERGNWTGKLDFLLSAVGYAVGLGNVWRFPYKAYANGGASFLIPYVIMLVFAGLPLFFLEMALGQFSSLGPISVWRVSPFFSGLGWAMVLISFMVCIYYNMIIAYTLYYIFASLTSRLPWADCKEDWLQYGCTPRGTNVTMRNITKMMCVELKSMHDQNKSAYMTDVNYTRLCHPKSPSEVYWEREVLDISSGITEGSGDMKWQLVLCLLLAWVIIFACLCKGIKSSGKVVYVTATFPYIVLVILLIRNCLLPGAIDGIRFYIIPDWSRLGDATVWHSAATQIFYSLGVAFGGLETMASYNRFRNNVYRDAVIVAVLNCATSVFAGFVIFSVIGFMANETGQKVQDVAADGPGLAFIAYPEGLAMMPAAPFWSILFFFMLFTLGLDSQFAMMEAIISAIVDEFPWFRVGKRKIFFILGLCILLFFLGLPQCARNGFYVMHLFDWYTASFSLMIVGLLELVCISWVYGLNRFCNDIELMIGYMPNWYWKVNWMVISPALLLFVIIFAGSTHADIYLGDYHFEKSANDAGVFLTILPCAAIVIVALIKFGQQRDWFKTLRQVTSPLPEWGPALDQYRTDPYSPLGKSEDGETTGANGHQSNETPSYVLSEKPSLYPTNGVTNAGYDEGGSTSKIYPL